MGVFMCGIIGYIGENNAIDFLHYGLKKLEYRGYDSAGVAYFNKNQLTVYKKVGQVDNLFDEKLLKVNSNIGIGHTRWATNGKISTENSHPHQSFSKTITLVHNGIIENCTELKNKYLKGINLQSETDTEVVANLLEFFYLKNHHKLDSIKILMSLLKGSYALAILFNDDCENIYFLKNRSPLVIGCGNNCNFISSDTLGFEKYTSKYIEIDDFEFGYINKKNMEIFDKNSKKITKNVKDCANFQKINNKMQFEHYMLKEIFEIPDAIKNTCELYKNFESIKIINKNLFNKIKRIKLIACGTSYHASLIGEKYFREIGFDAYTEIASEFLYNKQIWQKDTLYIFISQSGETADTLSCVELCKKHNAKTLCITNVPTSRITKICDYTLPICCGPEIAVASTKAFNGQVCSLLVLSKYLQFIKKINIKKKKLNKKDTHSTSINKLISKIIKISKSININTFIRQVKPLTQMVKESKNVFFVGKDYDYVLALESALKLKEISYINSVAYPSGELKHGTISLVDNNTLTFAYITEKKLSSKTLNVINQIKSRGGKVVVISPFIELQKFENIDYFIKLPEVNNYFYPIISIIPMQILSYYVSVSLGNNPDKPRNLAKSVTVE